jgi:hypothetical protein
MGRNEYSIKKFACRCIVKMSRGEPRRLSITSKYTLESCVVTLAVTGIGSGRCQALAIVSGVTCFAFTTPLFVVYDFK